MKIRFPCFHDISRTKNVNGRYAKQKASHVATHSLSLTDDTLGALPLYVKLECYLLCVPSSDHTTVCERFRVVAHLASFLLILFKIIEILLLRKQHQVHGPTQIPPLSLLQNILLQKSSACNCVRNSITLRHRDASPL